jgi:hypothetical protein
MLKAAARQLSQRAVGAMPAGARSAVKRFLPRWAISWYREQRSDVFLVSFPKCGRTWLRVMLGRALQDHYGISDDLGLVELHRLAELRPDVPCVVATHDEALLRRAEEFAGSTERYRGAPVILMVREPKDAFVSLFHHRQGRELHFDGSLDDFVDEPVGAFDSLMAFYDVWADRLNDPRERTLLVRYEDLHADTRGELRKVLRFIGVPADEAVVDQAVDFGAFDNMRQLEEADALGSDKLRPGKRGDYSTYKTRKGKVGGYRDELTEAQIAELDRRIAASRAARVLGYR